MTKPPRTVLTGWTRNSNEVTTPKLPPPPRRAQNKSSFSLALATRGFPSEVTISNDRTLSQVRPYFLTSQPTPPPSASPAIKNYLSKEADRGRCLKRGGNIEFVPLDTKRAEDLYRLEPADFLTAETIFDARWAMTLLNEAMVRLGQECAAQGKAATLQALEPFLDPSNLQVVPS